MDHESLSDGIPSEMAAYFEHPAARIERMVRLLSVLDGGARPGLDPPLR